MRPVIKAVISAEKYKLHVAFNDGTQGLLYLSHLAGNGVFKSWDEENTFFDVYLGDLSDITWPGEIDIDTYKVYCDLKGISADEYFRKGKGKAF